MQVDQIICFQEKARGWVARGAFSRTKYEIAPMESTGRLQSNMDPYVFEMKKLCFDEGRCHIA